MKPIVFGARGIVSFQGTVVNIGAEQNGAHVNGEDTADIAWGIKEDSDRARSWGKRDLNFFTWRKAAEQTIELYRKLIKPFEIMECIVISCKSVKFLLDDLRKIKRSTKS